VRHESEEAMTQAATPSTLAIAVRASNVDTLITNVKLPALPNGLEADLDLLKAASQEADDDVPTSWTFAGETLYIKAHGSGRQWRFILHCRSLHLDVGRGKLNGIVAKARLSSAFLWEQGPGLALATLYAFLVGFFGEGFTLQVSEAYLCCDVSGWDLSLTDAAAFVSRARTRKSYVLRADEYDADAAAVDHVDGEDDAGADAYQAPTFQVTTDGRLCVAYDFSKTAPHSCIIYDKTRELRRSRKDWMRAIWEQAGWDGQGRIIRVEFRYERDCLRELSVEEAYAFLDQLPGLWAYSTVTWLRHTTPDTCDTNQGRWPVSPLWRKVQQAAFFDAGEPAIRTRETAGRLRVLCQMLAGCSTKAAALLANALPQANAADFLTWFYDWMAAYHQEKGVTFEELRDDKRLRLGIVRPTAGTEGAA
jgi:hypothetical protein